LLGGPRCRWGDNDKKDFKEIEFKDMGWINLTQNNETGLAVINTVFKQLKYRG
jgi:hypothetical protein